MSGILRRGDVRLFGMARIALAILFLVRTTPLANYLFIPLARMRAPLFGWPEPGWSMAWGDLVVGDQVRRTACVVRTVAAVCFLLGIRARAAGVVAGVLGLFALSQDPFAFIFTLYVLFVATIALALTDAASHLALWPDPRPPVGVRASVTFLAVVVATVYAWSGIAKLRVEWLDGSALLALADDGFLTPLVTPVLRAHASLRLVVAWGAALVELGLAASLLLGATRRSALIVAVAMHFAFEVAVRPDVMGWVMAALLLALAPQPSREKEAVRRENVASSRRLWEPDRRVR